MNSINTSIQTSLLIPQYFTIAPLNLLVRAWKPRVTDHIGQVSRLRLTHGSKRVRRAQNSRFLKGKKSDQNDQNWEIRLLRCSMAKWWKHYYTQHKSHHCNMKLDITRPWSHPKEGLYSHKIVQNAEGRETALQPCWGGHFLRLF